MTRKGSWVLMALMLACAGSRGGLTVQGTPLESTPCSYEGPTRLRAGHHSLSVFPNGLGEYRIDVLRLGPGVAFEDVVRHYESGGGGFPPQTQRVAWVRHEDSVEPKSTLS